MSSHRTPFDATTDPPTVTPDAMLFLGRPFTSAESSATGVSAMQLRRLVREGTLRRLMAGVFVDAAAEDTPTLRAQALLCVLDRHVVVCDRSAAWLHGVDVLGAEGQSVVPPLEVFRIEGHDGIRRPQCRRGKRTLGDSDVQVIRGIPVTTPLRTALDLGRLARREEAIGAVDALMRIAGLSVEDLWKEMHRFRGARGVVQLRSLVGLANPLAESMAESKLRIQLHDAGLPWPEAQWPVRHGRGFVMFRLDLAYPKLKLAVEYDGRDHHTSVADRTRDDRRRAHLRRMGWTVVVLTARDVYGADARAARIVERELARLSKAA
ncbi:MAG TPA: DUF559 domain-containing protein [Nocardioidaceae bacterium]